MPEGKLLFLFLVHHKEAGDDGLMKPDGQSCCAETQPWRRRRLEQHRLPLKRGNLPFSDTPRTGKLWEFHFRSHGFAQLLVWWGRSHFWILQVPVNGVPCCSWDHLISILSVTNVGSWNAGFLESEGQKCLGCSWFWVWVGFFLSCKLVQLHWLQWKQTYFYCWDTCGFSLESLICME